MVNGRLMENGGEMFGFIRELPEGEAVYISAHVNPDGDAVGACAAMAEAVRQCGKKPVVLLEPLGAALSAFMPSEYLFEGDLDGIGNAELLIALDTSNSERLYARKLLGLARVTVSVDHHVSNERFALYNFVDDCAAATCQALYPLFKDGGIEINAAVARALYSGIVTDTGGFRHGYTSPETMNIAAGLMPLIDFSRVYTDALLLRTRAGLALNSRVLAGARFSEDGRVAWALARKADFDDCKADEQDAEGVAEALLNVVGVEAAFFFREHGDVTRVSARSRGVDLNAFLGGYGGGGHRQAAGATIKGGVDAVAETLVSGICKLTSDRL